MSTLPERFKTQTKLHDPDNGVEGNCTQAAIATLMGMELDEVPDFNTLHTGDKDAALYWDHIEKWFYTQGYHFMMQPKDRCWPGMYLADGPSPRGVGHFVVMKDGKMIHDPHPSREGIERIKHTYMVMPIDPATMQVKPGIKYVWDESLW